MNHSSYHFVWCTHWNCSNRQIIDKLLSFFPFPFLSFYRRAQIFRLPFDWKTPLGYLTALGMLCVEIHCIAFAAVPVIGFLIQSCRLLKTFVEDITKDVSRLVESSPHSSRITRTRKTTAEYFISLIQDHSTVKQLRFHLASFRFCSSSNCCDSFQICWQIQWLLRVYHHWHFAMGKFNHMLNAADNTIRISWVFSTISEFPLIIFQKMETWMWIDEFLSHKVGPQHESSGIYENFRPNILGIRMLFPVLWGIPF